MNTYKFSAVDFLSLYYLNIPFKLVNGVNFAPSGRNLGFCPAIPDSEIKIARPESDVLMPLAS